MSRDLCNHCNNLKQRLKELKRNVSKKQKFKDAVSSTAIPLPLRKLVLPFYLFLSFCLSNPTIPFLFFFVSLAKFVKTNFGFCLLIGLFAELRPFFFFQCFENVNVSDKLANIKSFRTGPKPNPIIYIELRAKYKSYRQLVKTVKKQRSNGKKPFYLFWVKFIWEQ